jgi:hypothetical protein
MEISQHFPYWELEKYDIANVRKETTFPNNWEPLYILLVLPIQILQLNFYVNSYYVMKMYLHSKKLAISFFFSEFLRFSMIS